MVKQHCVSMKRNVDSTVLSNCWTICLHASVSEIPLWIVCRLLIHFLWWNTLRDPVLSGRGMSHSRHCVDSTVSQYAFCPGQRSCFPKTSLLLVMFARPFLSSGVGRKESAHSTVHCSCRPICHLNDSLTRKLVQFYITSVVRR